MARGETKSISGSHPPHALTHLTPQLQAHTHTHIHTHHNYNRTHTRNDPQPHSPPPQHYDIANHFNEWAGGTVDDGLTVPGVPDYSLYPHPSTAREFCRHYLTARFGEFTEAALDTFMAPLATFRAVSNIYWGLWAVSQAKHEGCKKFPYLRYAIERLREGLRVAESLSPLV